MKATIKKGKHRTSAWWKFLRVWLFGKKILTRSVVFHESCLYELKNPDGTPDEDQADVNKLFGISLSLNPKRNSARFGWNADYTNKVIRLFWFVHNNEEMTFGEIGTCEIGKRYILTIQNEGSEWHFKFPAQFKFEIRPKKKGRDWFVYYLGFFFGGNKTAPHKMSADISVR